MGGLVREVMFTYLKGGRATAYLLTKKYFECSARPSAVAKLPEL